MGNKDIKILSKIKSSNSFFVFLLLVICTSCNPRLRSINVNSIEEIQKDTSIPITSQKTISIIVPSQMPTPILTASQTATFTPTVMPTPTHEVHLMAVGDIMLGRSIGGIIENDGVEKPFASVIDQLEKADLTIGNLECPISERGEPEEKAYAFRAPLSSAMSLKLAGFDLLNLANNHVLDFGQEAFFDTLESLEEQGIAFCGAGQDENSTRNPIILERNGLRIAFLGYLNIPIWKYDYIQWRAVEDEPGIAWGFRYDIKTDVEKVAQKSDIVVVMMHFGNEYEEIVSEQQIDLAHIAIDSGAHLVVGSHPHVLQAIEEYKHGLIVYSIGNFVFDQFDGKSNQSGIFSVHLNSDGIKSYELIPVIINSDGLPELQTRP